MIDDVPSCEAVVYEDVGHADLVECLDKTVASTTRVSPPRTRIAT